MRAWGHRHTHSVVSIVPEELGARQHLDHALRVNFPVFPNLKGGSLPKRLLAIRQKWIELSPDLVLTYNWGALEVVMAARLFGLGPLVHHEDGFGPDEVITQKSRRVWFRRLALPAASQIVVPSRNLEMCTRDVWWQPKSRVSRVPNGVDVGLYQQTIVPTVLPGVDRRDGMLQVGTVAGLRPEKNLCRLVRVFADASRGLNARLVIVGDGTEYDSIRTQAINCGISDKVFLTGFLPDPHRYLGLFDVFALTSDTEQFPISLVEAMAARLPAVSTDVGDIMSMLPPENQEFVKSTDDESGLAESLRRLLVDSALRASVGTANRVKAENEYSLHRMIVTYDDIYGEAMRLDART